MTAPSPAPTPATEAGNGRLLSSLQGLSATLIDIFQTRLELLATEVEEEKRRMLAVLGWGAVAIVMGTVASVFLAGLITVLCWDSHPLLALGGLTLAFTGICLVAMRKVSALVHSQSGMLADSLAELREDHDALTRAASRGHPDAAPASPEQQGG